MSKKVLILSSSPRKGGNSDILCDQFLKGAKESGHEVEKIFLGERKINYCLGCEGCAESKVCVWHDDMAEVLDKMIESDVIVMATPVYFYTMDAQMKTLIDRTVPRYTEIRNKEFYFIMTAADSSKESLERTLEGFRGFTSCLSGATENGVIYGTGVWKKGEVRKSKDFEIAYNMGRNI
ncbi:flavodoxin family protein [Clostridium ihumii]|uniref:flavodoxin family protein n=1 Tax=Clostridium ihumii TaxID=1470356 RepID=UPI00058EB27A|nr:flavodoxin family protein [Clostridium ihumii]